MTGEQAWYTFDTIADSIPNSQTGESWTTEADVQVMENCPEYQAQKAVQSPAGSQLPVASLRVSTWGPIRLNIIINKVD